MSKLVTPHGGDSLRPLMVPQVERAEEAKRAERLRKITMSSRETSDLIMLAMGAYTPLSGFMGYDDWRGVCQDMKRADGLFWPIPITLSTDRDTADALSIGEEVALVCGETQTIMGVLEVTETYTIDKKFECEHIFRTHDPEHPGVQKVMEQGEVNVAGHVRALSEGTYAQEYSDLFMRPADTRAMFADKGWSTVAAFQTRNPMHRSHEHLAKIAVELCDGVLIHQVLGKLKPGDVPAETRVKAIERLVTNYFVPGTVVQAGYPIEMRYAGPREALLHAVFRQNFGCSHLVVGRDHAGVGDYYGPFDAQHIFDELWDGALKTQPIKVDITFYCEKCDGMATARSCPHDKEERVTISGTRLREMLGKGEEVSPKFSRPEVLEILYDYYQNKTD